MYPFGSTSKTTILKSESHKLFQEFEVNTGQTVKKGQPVVLAGDEKVSPAGTSSTALQIIGFSMHDAAAGELITVMMKAHAIIFVECETDGITAGPVRLGSTAAYNSTSGYVLIDDATVSATNMIGWALEAGDDGDIVRLAVL